MKLRQSIYLGMAVCLGTLARAQTVVQNTTYNSGNTVIVSGPDTIDAANNVTVGSGATVTYQAATSVWLGPGFHAKNGSFFHAVLSANQPVTVTSSAPGGLTFGASSPVTVTFAATDTHGTVVKMELYRNGVLIGTLTSPTSGSTWTFADASSLSPGIYTYEARAYDSNGVITNSAPVTATVLPILPYPYLTDFEASEGYTLGSLNQQLGWSVGHGSALISNQDAAHGTQSVVLQASTPPTQITQGFAPQAGETIVFVDFFAKPVAATDVTTATIFNAGSTRFAFVLSGSGQGVLQAFNGNGFGGGSWISTPFTAPLGASNQSQNWIRLTARLDFTRKTWDLYSNGVMVAADLGFLDLTSTTLASFSVQGVTATTSKVDDLLAGPQNPLFTDANSDGIDDTWEQQYGLSLSVNDRYLDLTGNGLTVLQQYINGANPSNPQALAVGFVLFSPSP